MSYEKVKDKATEFTVPLTWALKKRRGYLEELITQSEKLSTYKKRLESQIEEYRRRIKEGDYSKQLRQETLLFGRNNSPHPKDEQI